VLGVQLSDEISVKLEEVKLENGTVIVAESFAKGESVFIKSEDDENIALPIGDYELEDGRKLIVTEEGLIDSIGEAKEEEVEAKEDTESKEEVEVEAEEEEVVLEYVTKEEFTSALEEIKGMIQELSKNELSEETPKEELPNQQTNEEVELSAEVEIVEPLKHNPEKDDKKFSFKISNTDSQIERIYKRLNNN
jgi:tRNA G10  N-methylase Trm11